jgi:hypothetical protein
MPWLQSWLELVRTATARGVRYTRVRVVTLPLTEYSRFGVYCARLMKAAGEDIRYLNRDAASAGALPQHDYWLFDSRVLVQMQFDDSNRFVGGQVVNDPTSIVEHNYWRDAAWHHADRWDDFAAQQGI